MFKAKGYNLTFKKRFMKMTLGYVPTISNMTTHEIETVMNALNTNREKAE